MLWGGEDGALDRRFVTVGQSEFSTQAVHYHSALAANAIRFAAFA
jgi:hypothetical protein